ncbi:Charged multivesicular body protein 3 [Kappamyces sp. JEL0829]|nr:Charged multivesicular body protein 3 [Kappamyces sp. JEL0829]
MSAIVDLLIGKRLTPEEQVKKWRSQMRSQERELDKTLRNIDQEQAKAKKLIKQAAKRNDMESCKILAREVVASNKAKNRIITSKAQMNSLVMNMQQQLGMAGGVTEQQVWIPALISAAVAKVTGALEKSTEVMKLVNRLMKLPAISQTMQTMSMEMMKAGVIQEMINDTLEAADEDEIEEEAQEEVDKVLYQLTDGVLGQAGAVGAELPSSASPVQSKVDDDMEARLKALHSV